MYIVTGATKLLLVLCMSYTSGTRGTDQCAVRGVHASRGRCDLKTLLLRRNMQEIHKYTDPFDTAQAFFAWLGLLLNSSGLRDEGLREFWQGRVLAGKGYGLGRSFWCC